MSTQSYFPHNESERISWITHFCDKFPVQGPVVGVSAEEINNTIADLTYYIWLIQNWYLGVQQHALEATAYKHSMAMDESAINKPLPVAAAFDNPPPQRPSGILARLFKLVQRIKNSSNYTESIGLDLGLIGIQKDDTHAYPDANLSLKRNADGEVVAIDFVKHHHSAILIESRRNGGEWTFLGVALVSPWIDERPVQAPTVPEVREYRLCWYANNKIGGVFSPIQKITVAP